MIKMCSGCGRVRGGDSRYYVDPRVVQVNGHYTIPGQTVSHGICLDCIALLYGAEMAQKMINRRNVAANS